MATLFVVGTPIGNLEDITLRALRVLKEVDLILCEDTRVTKRLLLKYEIGTPTMSYHAQSKLAKVDKILSLLEEGKNLALVSDAGTPCISDPGALLVSQILDSKVKGQLLNVSVVPIPGPSALVTALSSAGISVAEFTFLGFLPHKKGRETLFKEIADSSRVIAFYESPHRIEKTLESLEKFCGTERNIIIARELTKIYEEFARGTVSDVKAHFAENPDRIRGEFVVIVLGRM
ncbi:MAG: 16S rRNA (cytidine(1402)-2'-O)-methyltransferase [Candidatus Yonathbacteria bacterium CG10_big_fil_rev_8_21_14_0_10_43_136]|uniref:Ribosomal RNA small subunit methyltransferase I n=2 Tax=Parcubacteria group TaxID=1794811 RepID=A0A2M7Q5S7_9BACT|nr:MAG: 16S rRNA (cytidine(1402)-2'-O)-methyltransferase [Candidatus Nomurabacteria bacterium CG2_30_43_9]PIQ36152.1 MAG: 16S rRNA (cytidine(1402)-2'-O)-methyltransferase [Candidatus Yonathbacteria bacterium CG17_big_fil_post_rev_8_21_14_2_50_43_9]PIR40721.1 MAG: 16S rRNA (cytidine(1402)-2'-O)-methyltransferase [Candidatus Yonathbacteria bacterium CG10_big_fil_rev_8_21_14_0_10_43_136]PIX56988.1 MAG: 16S rRNA (cytidine(1402)-2'-O)-methyltransferase [Candidatus Yonathbacteria bacterium CG_4_10_14_